VATKLLHLKRPLFYPVLDQVVRQVYEEAAAAASVATAGKPPGKRSGRYYWAAVRADLIKPKNIDALEGIRARLRKDRGPQADRLLRVVDLRLLDMLAWLAGTGALTG
jgi:hypothetical protein